jgi:hypothetical protein
MPADRKAFALRLDPALYECVARLAATDLRSVNAEIECLLREALKARGVKIETAKDDAETEARGVDNE